MVPWPELVALIEPHYLKPGNGRPPVGVEWMLRIYSLQQWFNLSEPGVEDALYDSLEMRGFVNIDLPPHGRRPVRRTPDLGREPAPDETTVCKFRHLLERHKLGRPMLAQGNAYLEKHGLYSWRTGVGPGAWRRQNVPPTRKELNCAPHESAVA